MSETFKPTLRDGGTEIDYCHSSFTNDGNVKELQSPELSFDAPQEHFLYLKINEIESGGVDVGEAESSHSFLKCRLEQEGLGGKDDGNAFGNSRK